MNKKVNIAYKILAIKAVLKCVLISLEVEKFNKINEVLENNFNEIYDQLPDQVDEIKQIQLIARGILSSRRE